MSDGPILSAANRYRCNGCTQLRKSIRCGSKINAFICTHDAIHYDLALIGLTDATPDWCPFLKLQPQPKASTDGE